MGSAVELEINPNRFGRFTPGLFRSVGGVSESPEERVGADSTRRLTTNPMRILDSKNAATQKLLESAPDLRDFIDWASRGSLKAYVNTLIAMALTIG
ncbi:MAG: hypothetical protein Ct9H300mP8_05160 [Gammaproteobacteria bacterium]|nr:MAG: hypothetical protein Ct9H300mP8_05160 [Gammaproteobacteria bacterium]